MLGYRSSAGLFLFFQAEDGRRYFHVTGVQTCALPISSRARRPAGKAMRPWDPARGGVAEREVANPRARKGSSHSRAVSTRQNAVSNAGRFNGIGGLYGIAAGTARSAGHHPTDDEADDSIPDDVALRTICVVHEGNSKAPAAGRRRATAPLRRRQD